MKENSNWLFSTALCNGSLVGDTPTWQGRPILRSSVGTAQIVSDVADNLGMDPINVLRVQRGTDEAIVARIKRGQNVNMELVGYSIVLTGSFDGSDGTFDPERNMLRVSAYAKPILRDCLKGIVPRNVTQRLKATIFSVQDSVAHEEGVVTVPSVVLVAGTNIHMGPNDDEWCGLFTKKGELAARATVLANDGGTANLSFGELPADGEYTLTIFARNGAPTDRQPAVARRAVIVRNAS
ncbi:MAG: hypothetical protein IJ658_11190 [Kiritimatiellae bacterium]|nr:hypothetical protein [Kiritimatiellia bacterium]